MAEENPKIDLSEESLARIRKIADKATPGPYAIDRPPHGSPHVVANPGTLEKRYIAYCCPFPGPDAQHMNNAQAPALPEAQYEDGAFSYAPLELSMLLNQNQSLPILPHGVHLSGQKHMALFAMQKL